MKKIEIVISDETVEALEKVILARYYYNYPKGQAYSLAIDELVSEIQKLPLQSGIPCCCCYVPPHSIPPSWWV